MKVYAKKIYGLIVVLLMALSISTASPALAANAPEGKICTSLKGNMVGEGAKPYAVAMDNGRLSQMVVVKPGYCTDWYKPGWGITAFRVYLGYTCTSQWGHVYTHGMYWWTGNKNTTLTLTCKGGGSGSWSPQA